MSEPQRNHGGWGTAFSILLFISSAAICFLVIVCFVLGLRQYYEGKFIDYQLGLLRPEDAKWLVSLFTIPIVLQMAGIFVMFKLLLRDKSLTVHYAFCMVIMSTCPLSYCVLWIFYMWGWHSWAILSYVALGAIVFLLLPVILMTYAIMWTSLRRTTSDIKEEDIQNLSTLCSALKNDRPALRHDGAFAGYRTRILEGLDNDLRGKLMLAQDDSDYESIKSELVSGLNRVLRNPDLHLTINVNNQAIGDEARELLIRRQRHLTTEEVQRLHRLLLEASFPNSIRASQIRPRSKVLKYFRKASEYWEDFLSDIKEGITKAHFWVLANFFAVFLGVTFLFGFAFAFHDQDAIAKKREPDLYMAKTLSSLTVAEQLVDDATASPQPEPLPGYTFYFDSSSAHPEWVEHPEFNDKPYVPIANDLRKNWTDGINYSRLERIVDDISRLTTNGEKLRVELVGSTDYCDLQAAPYSSNYELSEARAQNIKYLLIENLLKRDPKQRDIEWLTVPVSSEGSPIVALPADTNETVNCGDGAASNHPSRKKKRDPDVANKLISQLENRKSTLLIQELLHPDNVRYLQNKFDDLKMLINNDSLSENAIEEPLIRINALIKAMTAVTEAKIKNSSHEEIVKLTKVKTRKEVELQESLDAFKYVDENAGMRVVAVSLKPVQESRWFKRLSLMDYMYFTIYTITTTGYGDIVPTTNFAKFLCSAANILEVFFLVVFFNALLSVKRDDRFARTTDRR